MLRRAESNRILLLFKKGKFINSSYPAPTPTVHRTVSNATPWLIAAVSTIAADRALAFIYTAGQASIARPTLVSANKTIKKGKGKKTRRRRTVIE